MLAKEGLEYVTEINSNLRAEGIQVAVSGDIWSDRGVSLLGICQYHIAAKFKIHELVRRPQSYLFFFNVLTVICACTGAGCHTFQ